MALTIKKMDNGNVLFNDGVKGWSYIEAYACLYEGDYVYVRNELSNVVIIKLDYNDVTSVESTAGGLVLITNVLQLYSELVTNVFYKTV